MQFHKTNNRYNDYKEHKFYKMALARNKQLELKRKYGYKPTIFQISNSQGIYYSIIEPKDLTPIRRK